MAVQTEQTEVGSSSDAGWRVRLGERIESQTARRIITALILINAAILGVETSDSAREVAGAPLQLMNQLILAVFVVEILIKLVAFGPRFFKSGWNVFDFLIISISLIPTSGPLAILRTLRILRVLRLLSTVKRLRLLVESLMQAMPGIGWSAALLLMMFYIFGVMGTELFGRQFPEWFGTLGRSIYSLFQVMTLESWSMGIARPVMEEFPYAWAYFVPFILISSFMVLNLFIAIIVSATQEVHEMEQRAERAKSEQQAHVEREEMLDLLRSMNTRLEELERRLSK
ncbi:ion transporter [Hoyosella altamirensis]|uniref:Voltage-gated sodium channel n=1 Tax=Hoyosella altamirensis TaxID=616997 RepID=A0A839RPE8_9ACTN|nr:ion transporter [Hoyosella altamirensis]MBB3038400.1 voltage-gated sodium channel [Hoyosella altamirensis]